MNWSVAHRVAAVAAAHLRQDMGLPEDRYVDVMDAIRRIDVAVMAQPMPRLFGVYLPATTDRGGGILLNSTLNEATLRHTAAHEWGHHAMRHGRCFAEDLDALTGSPRAWTPEEKQAEAFAAWLLMPIKAVKSGLALIGTDHPRTAGDAYQLSLHLGTSLRGTIRHLVHLRLVAPATGRTWAAIDPARLRTQLCSDRHDVPARVWDLGAAVGGARLPVHVGDRLLIRGQWATGTGLVLPVGIEVAEPTQPTIDEAGLQLDICDRLETESVVRLKSTSRGSAWSVFLHPTPSPHRGLISIEGKSSTETRPAREM